MVVSYGFHSEAADQYLAATRYYLDHASSLVAAAFVAEIEAAIQTLLTSPTTWPIIEEPQNSPLPAKAISLFSLLSLGTRERKSFILAVMHLVNYLGTGVIAPNHECRPQ